MVLDSHPSTILFRTQEECTKGIYFNIHILESVNSLIFLKSMNNDDSDNEY